MHRQVKSFIVYTGLILLPLSMYSQLSVKYPEICHDQDGYLRHYDNGIYTLNFNEGRIREISSNDTAFRYSEPDMTITFVNTKMIVQKIGSETPIKYLSDTVHISLLDHSLLFRNSDTAIELTSVMRADIPAFPGDEFGINFTYNEQGKITGFIFNSLNKQCKVTLWSYDKKWSWEFRISDLYDNEHAAGVSYNGRTFQQFSFVDKQLRYGIIVGTSAFRKSGIIDRLYSVAPLHKTDPPDGPHYVPVNQTYSYNYDKEGKVKNDKRIGEIKLCKPDSTVIIESKF